MCSDKSYCPPGQAGCGTGGIVSATTAKTLPNPTNIAATAIMPTELTLTWVSGGAATPRFRVAFREGVVPPDSCFQEPVIKEDQFMGTSVVVRGLNPGRSYAFRVCGVDKAEPGFTASGGTTFLTATVVDPLALAPNDPIGVSPTVDSSSRITLNWTSGGGTTAGFRIAYKPGPSAPVNCASDSQIGPGSIGGSSHAITGLVSNQQYSFRVCATNANPTPVVSGGVTTTATTAPQAAPSEPTAPSATADTYNQITVAWTSGGGTTAGYRISYQTGATAPATCALGTPISENSITGTSRAVTGLTHETQYSFRICSINGNATPDASNGVTATATTLGQPTPNNPTSPNATADSAVQITLSWTSGGGTTADYRIAYQSGATAPVDCASGTQIGEGSISGTSHAVSGLTHETQYSFRICAINANATPNVSSGVTATATTQGQAAPSEPTSPSATANSDVQITLAWTSGGGTTAGYRIAHQTGATAPVDCASGTQIPSGSISGTSHAVSGLTHETQYSFRICAINANATPNVSAGVTTSATTQSQAAPNEPTSPTATPNSSSQMTLDWTSGGGTTAGYRIAYSTGATAPTNCASGIQIPAGSITGTSHVLSSLTHETQYSFRICAVNANATPNVSTGVTFSGTTNSQDAPFDPSTPVATPDSTSQITLNWASGGGTTAGYRIAYQTGATAPANCAIGNQIASGSISGTSHAVSGLTIDTQYSFRICAINANATPNVSTGVTASAYTDGQAVPNDPTSPTATANSATQVTVAWTSGGGTTVGFRIAYLSGGTAPANCATGTTIPEGTIGGYSHAVTGLTATTQYSFRVCAINGDTIPDPSGGVTVSATTLQAPPPDPTGLTANAINSSQISLAWTSGGGSTNDYRISYFAGATAPGDCSTTGTLISDTAVNGTGHTVGSLTDNTQYTFRICAINGNTTPDVSSGITASATTLLVAPPNPTILAWSSTSSTVDLSWTSGGGTTSGYLISYKAGSSAPVDCSTDTTIASGSIAGTSHTVIGLSAGTMYTFLVCAINANSSPDMSSGVSYTISTLSREQFVSIAGGATANHSCGIVANGSAYCWGQNSSGQLGDVSTAPRTEPTAVNQGALSANGSFVSLNLGQTHSCGLTNTGKAY